MPWGWLAAIFLLCSLQGWLLSITSLLMFLVFLALIGLVSQAIADTPNSSSDFTDFTYFRDYPVAATPRIKILSVVWAALVGWNWAEATLNLWYGAINWQVAIAIGNVSTLATAIAWLWATVAAVLGKKITGTNLARFWILSGTSWLGIFFGKLIGLLF
jgi:hypothetical protein